MQKIDKVVLQNVQSHEATTLDLSPGFNVITGSTEGGKTAIMRGDRLLVDNKPAGTAWVRKDKNDEPVGTLTVIHEYASGHKVARVRGKSVNRYIITDPDGTTKTLEGFGTDVPEEVQAITGIRPAVFFDDGKGKSFAPVLNFAFQLEAPFMLSETPGLGAKVFGHLAGTGIVDAALDDLNKDLFDANKRKRAADDEIAQKESALTQYEGLDGIRFQYNRAESVFTAVLDDVDRFNRLGTLAAELGQVDAGIIWVNGILESLSGLQRAKVTLGTAATDWINCKRLTVLADDYYRNTADLYRANDTLDALAGLPRAETVLAGVTVAWSGYRRLTDLDNTFHSINSDLFKVEKILDKLTGLNALDNALAGIKANQNRVGVLNAMYEYNRATVNQLEDCRRVIYALDKVSEADVYLQQLKGQAERLDLLKGLLEQYAGNELALGRVGAMLQEVAEVDTAAEVLGSVQGALERVSRLMRLEVGYNLWTGQLAVADELLAGLAGLETGTNVLNKVQGDFGKLARLERLHLQYQENDYEIKTLDTVLKSHTEEIQAAEADYNRILQEAGVCPTCGQKIKGGLNCGN